MKEEVIIKGQMKSGKEIYGNHRNTTQMSLEETIAKIKFRRTIRRLLKMIKM